MLSVDEIQQLEDRLLQRLMPAVKAFVVPAIKASAREEAIAITTPLRLELHSLKSCFLELDANDKILEEKGELTREAFCVNMPITNGATNILNSELSIKQMAEVINQIRSEVAEMQIREQMASSPRDALCLATNLEAMRKDLMREQSLAEARTHACVNDLRRQLENVASRGHSPREAESGSARAYVNVLRKQFDMMQKDLAHEPRVAGSGSLKDITSDVQRAEALEEAQNIVNSLEAMVRDFEGLQSYLHRICVAVLQHSTNKAESSKIWKLRHTGTEVDIDIFGD